MCKLSQAYLKINLLSQICSTKRYKKWINTNVLLSNPRYSGIKTGFTPNAGACLAVSYSLQREDQILVVLIGARDINRRFQEVDRLVQWVVQYLEISNEPKIRPHPRSALQTRPKMMKT